jgi:hypothetical protein
MNWVTNDDRQFREWQVEGKRAPLLRAT